MTIKRIDGFRDFSIDIPLPERAQTHSLTTITQGSSRSILLSINTIRDYCNLTYNNYTFASSNPVFSKGLQ